MSWWVALTHPSCERRAAAGLVERGFEAWLPMRHVEFKTRHMKAKATRDYPLFPGYLFVRAGAERYLLSAVDGVRGLLCNEWTPLTIDDDELERVRRRVENPVRMVEDAWKIGDTVMIVDGPFCGHEGIIAPGGRRGALAVLLSLFGRQTAAEMLVEQLELVERAARVA